MDIILIENNKIWWNSNFTWLQVNSDQFCLKMVFFWSFHTEIAKLGIWSSNWNKINEITFIILIVFWWKMWILIFCT